MKRFRWRLTRYGLSWVEWRDGEGTITLTEKRWPIPIPDLCGDYREVANMDEMMTAVIEMTRDAQTANINWRTFRFFWLPGDVAYDDDGPTGRTAIGWKAEKR